ncbi:MAG: TolC family protein [Acidobacteriaceae bacterium]
MRVIRLAWSCSVVLLVSAFLTGNCLRAQELADDLPELTLSQAVQLAIDHNRPVKIAQLDITKARWQVAQAKSKRFPQISTYFFGSGNLTSPSFTFKKGIFGTVNNAPSPSQDTHIKLSQGFTGYAVAQVAQPVTQLYKIHLAIREQELGVDLAGQKYQAKRQSVVADVRQAYYAVLQTESALHVAQVTVKQYQETDRVVLDYVAQRSALQSSSLEVKAKLAQSQYQVVQLSDTLTTQKEYLNNLLGRDLDTPFRTEQVPPISPEELDLKLARQTSLAKRPEIKEAEIDVRRADYDRKLAKSQYIPDIGAAFHYLSPINTQVLPENIASAGVEMKWDPFEWGARRDDVKQKETTVEQSKYQLQETRSQILLDVDNTFRKLSESRSLVVVAGAARDAADEKLREVTDQFGKSVVLLRDLLEQQAATANADHEYQQSLLGFWSAKANFEKALGEE